MIVRRLFLIDCELVRAGFVLEEGESCSDFGIIFLTSDTSASCFQEVVYRKVIEDDGYSQLVEVDQAAAWKFLCAS